MEVQAQYLNAIQSIAGSTPGEKYKTINLSVKKIASNFKGDRVVPKDVPEALMPLVRVEIAKLLRQNDWIIEALKSEDLTIVRRALKATWFFEDLNKKETVTSCRYFLRNLLAEISLFARSKVIKKFGIHLRDAKIGAEFFKETYETYGANQAIPLLLSCDENFTLEIIIQRNIVLPTWMVRKIYRKYPSLVINYLKLAISESKDEKDVRNICKINIDDYKEFLPTIAKDRFEDFMAIYDSHELGIDLKLDEKTSNKFVESSLNLITTNPSKYLNLAPLKIVTEKLSDDEFKGMFKKLFPPDKNDFAYDYLYGKLKYYKSKENRAPLILDTFREVYGEDLLSGKFLTSSNFERTLPAFERIKYARSMLKRDKFWYYWDHRYSWRCYLPTSESIPLIIREIARTSNRSKRIGLEEQLFFTCEVNEDEKALLRVLNYLYDNHRNDDYSLKIICSSCDATKLGPAHWKVFEKSLKLLLKTRGYYECEEITKALETAFHYCSSNDIPFDEYVDIFVNLQIDRGREVWNVLKKFMYLEKNFLQLFVKFISKRHPFAKKKWKDCEFDIVRGLATSLWDFNERHKNILSKKLSVEDHPWLMKNIERLIVEDNETQRESKKLFFVRCREQEPDLYAHWIRKYEKFWLLGARVILDVLYKDPKRVSKNWKECLKEVQETNGQKDVVEIFIRDIKWHEKLPINFFNELIASHLVPETRVSSLKILALLTDGLTNGKIIEAFITRENKIDIDDVALNLSKVNPPVGLKIISKIFDGDYYSETTLRFSENFCRRLKVAEVTSLAKILTKSSSTVSKKQGIGLMRLVAPLEEQYATLASMCKIEKDVSIRRILFRTIRDLFRAQPDPRSWKLFENCIGELVVDDVEIFKNFCTFSTVPNEYIFPYIKTVLNAIESERKRSEDPKFSREIICGFIKSIDDKIAELLPEEYLQDLIRRYLFVFEFDSKIADAATELTVNRYILTSIKNDRLTTRLKFLGDHLRCSIKKYWDTPCPDNRKFYPMNFMVNRFFQRMCSEVTERTDVRIYEKLLKTFLSVLEPHQDASSYLQLVFSVGFHGSETSKNFGKKMSKIVRETMEIFSPEYAVFVVAKLAEFMKTRAFNDPETTDETIFTIAEIFLQEGSVPCAMIAANMLFDTKSKKFDQRHEDLINSLHALQHSGVSSVVNANLSAFKYPDPKYDDYS